MTSVDSTRKRRKIRAVLASGLVLGVGVKSREVVYDVVA